ncbi:MAG TPA: hypothetical protein VI894_03605 [Candidatus Nanoarchaeia archaeon]|nr:hypothetical protein [Candidatus Nanoarchaeia archaeon]
MRAKELKEISDRIIELTSVAVCSGIVGAMTGSATRGIGDFTFLECNGAKMNNICIGASGVFAGAMIISKLEGKKRKKREHENQNMSKALDYLSIAVIAEAGYATGYFAGYYATDFAMKIPGYFHMA